ncbi:hypothetical protein Tco_1376988 [Tanacetum coccineum]
MASMNTRLNIEKLDGNIVQKHEGSKQVGFKQFGPGVETGVHGVHDEKPRDKEQHSAHELLKYREDSNEAAFAVAEAEKIYAHESLTFNNTVACEVISKWKAGLKDDMDARSDVYVLSNGCKKCSDDSDVYYWEYTPRFARKSKAKYTWYGDLQGSEWKYSEGVTVQVLQREVGTDFVGGTLHTVVGGSLSGDCDVEKNGKWSCIYAVGSQEYQMVCTRLDIASEDVGMLDKFDRGLQTDVQVFVDFDYTMGRSITVMGRSITSGVHDTYGGCKGGYLAKGTRNRVRIRAKDSSVYCYRCLVKGDPWSEVPAQVKVAAYRY